MAPFVVLYNAAGRGNLSSCFIDLRKPIIKHVNGSEITLQGFIAEHKTYRYYPRNKEEGNYLISILNSNMIFSILRGIKSARDIEKKVWELPIPKFESAVQTHTSLSDLGKECTEEATEILKEKISYIEMVDILQTATVGNLRKSIKDSLSHKLKEIDEIVLSLVRK